METQANVRSGLEGRLEVVKILPQHTSNLAFGRLVSRRDHEDVLVFNGIPYINKYCLVNFGLHSKKDNRPPIAGFISTGIPHEFKGLPYEKYVLFAEWSSDWVKEIKFNERNYPTKQEIMSHFFPRDLGRIIYFSSDSTPKYGRMIINSKGLLGLKGSISRVINRSLLTLKESARIVIFESQNDFYELQEQLKSRKIALVKMEPLKKLDITTTSSQYQRD